MNDVKANLNSEVAYLNNQCAVCVSLTDFPTLGGVSLRLGLLLYLYMRRGLILISDRIKRKKGERVVSLVPSPHVQWHVWRPVSPIPIARYTLCWRLVEHPRPPPHPFPGPPFPWFLFIDPLNLTDFRPTAGIEHTLQVTLLSQLEWGGGEQRTMNNQQPNGCRHLQ
jgi:hypothetical protein